MIVSRTQRMNHSRLWGARCQCGGCEVGATPLMMQNIHMGTSKISVDLTAHCGPEARQGDLNRCFGHQRRKARI